MPNYKYKARDSFARPVSGTILAETRELAAKKISDLGYVPISVEEVRELSVGRILDTFQRVNLKELSAFTRQLYALQKAGLPLLSSLESISQQTKNEYFRAVILEIARDIRGGANFSATLNKYPRIFNEIYLSMIKAGETGGSMPDILDRLTGLIEQDIDTRSRISAATRYPLMAFCVLCLGFLIVVSFVIPRFAVIYGQFNAVLPLPTRILIFISVTLQNYWYWFILFLGAGIFGFHHFINSKTGRPVFDNFKLKVPVLGELVTMLIMSRFTRVTAILMKSGVPILEILDLGASASGNIIIRRAILNIKESVNQGKGMSEPMKLSNLFPPAVVQMTSVGEQTGRVDELFLSVADYYDRESGYMIKNLTTYIEPALIFVLAAMVLVMALAIFLPMWNLIKIFKPG